MGSSEGTADFKSNAAGLKEPIEAASFWLAVLLPAAYLPLFYLGLGGTTEAAGFVTLVAVHLFVLTIGHTHRR
ncbi:hypothetical protein [Natronomonas sp.]|uniref:hypothetical protein n=1 Tax=Natronomonas sp. TaxID=2184060 RepID=UPI003988CF9D